MHGERKREEKKVGFWALMMKCDVLGAGCEKLRKKTFYGNVFLFFFNVTLPSATTGVPPFCFLLSFSFVGVLFLITIF